MQNELKYATEFAKINHFKILLGGGSNLLFTQDFDGLVIKLNLKGISEEILDENHVHVSAKREKTGMNLYCTRFLKIMAD